MPAITIFWGLSLNFPIYYHANFFSEEALTTAPNPIFVYECDLEPLNEKLTAFINENDALLADYM